MNCCQSFLLTSTVVLIFSIVLSTLLPHENNIAMTEDKKITMRQNLKASVVGYTGQIGQKLVEELAKSSAFSMIKLVGRRKTPEFDTDQYSKCEQAIVNFDNLEAHGSAFEGADVAFCTLGTTRGKAGVEGFKKVDYDYVVSTAKTALEAGVKEFHLVTSQGANKDSTFLYPQTKGLVEAAISEMGFDKVFIYRPAFLIESNRPETRIGEVIAHCVMFPVIKMFPTFISVPIQTVAQAMVVVSSSEDGVMRDTSETNSRIFDNKEIHSIAKLLGES